MHSEDRWRHADRMGHNPIHAFMAEIDGEQYAARKLGCEISADPLNPLERHGEGQTGHRRDTQP